MSFSIHGSHADSLYPQIGTQEEISDALGVSDDSDEPQSLALVLSDMGNMHALVIDGDGNALRAWYKRLGEVIDKGFPDANVQALKDLASGNMDEGTEPLDLDNDVHDAASRLAIAANNGGIDDQVDFLVQQLGYTEASTIIRACAEWQR